MSDAVEIMFNAMERTQRQMTETAARMEVASTEFGFDMMTEISEHATQLRGAANILQTWIDGIRNEVKK